MSRLSNEDADPRGPLVTASKVADLCGGGVMQAFAYCVTFSGKSGDRRSSRRRRTRLRSGKLLDLHNAFLIECLIYDRSDIGARVRLLTDIPAANAIRLYEDCPERLFDARVIWRRDRELGLRFVPSVAARRLSRTQLTCLRDRYYAIDA